MTVVQNDVHMRDTHEQFLKMSVCLDLGR